MVRLVVIGGGLAGCEAAWQAARGGVGVDLYEMRPLCMTAVHKTGNLAELVCSNSLGTNNPEKAPGLLKSELRLLGSLLMACADETAVPAGQALAVDRTKFSERVEERIRSQSLIRVIREEVPTIPAVDPAIAASGPMTSPRLAESLQKFFGEEHLYFYDAVSPIVTLESLDSSVIFRASRYGKGEEAYLNVPFTKEEYLALRKGLLEAETVPLAGHDRGIFFESCLPVEELARRGEDTLRFGPMKPVGLSDPATGRRPYAVLQLRQENREGSLYNLVGFQTRLRWPEQERVFRLIPGFSRAEFVRLGVMHRNLYVNAPRELGPTGQTKKREELFLAGQITGVEGYVESTASGWLAGTNAARLIQGEKPLVPPAETALGALMHHIAGAAAEGFQPMNVNFGIFPPLSGKFRSKQERNRALLARAKEGIRALC